MKLAIASNNGVTIQRHFGRTGRYVVVTFDGNGEVTREKLEILRNADYILTGTTTARCSSRSPTVTC